MSNFNNFDDITIDDQVETVDTNNNYDESKSQKKTKTKKKNKNKGKVKKPQNKQKTKKRTKKVAKPSKKRKHVEIVENNENVESVEEKVDPQVTKKIKRTNSKPTKKMDRDAKKLANEKFQKLKQELFIEKEINYLNQKKKTYQVYEATYQNFKNRIDNFGKKNPKQLDAYLKELDRTYLSDYKRSLYEKGPNNKDRIHKYHHGNYIIELAKKHGYTIYGITTQNKEGGTKKKQHDEDGRVMTKTIIDPKTKEPKRDKNGNIVKKPITVTVGGSYEPLPNSKHKRYDPKTGKGVKVVFIGTESSLDPKVKAHKFFSLKNDEIVRNKKNILVGIYGASTTSTIAATDAIFKYLNCKDSTICKKSVIVDTIKQINDPSSFKKKIEDVGESIKDYIDSRVEEKLRTLNIQQN
jgi:hypothetical protein